MPSPALLDRPADIEVKVGVKIDSLGRRWDPAKHPRDSQGRFIETGGIVRVGLGKLGKVTRVGVGGKVEVQLSDGRRDFFPHQQLTMVRRPDGTKPTLSARKVLDEDQKREKAPDRGDGKRVPDAGGIPIPAADPRDENDDNPDDDDETVPDAYEPSRSEAQKGDVVAISAHKGDKASHVLAKVESVDKDGKPENVTLAGESKPRRMADVMTATTKKGATPDFTVIPAEDVKDPDQLLEDAAEGKKPAVLDNDVATDLVEGHAGASDPTKGNAGRPVVTPDQVRLMKGGKNGLVEFAGKPGKPVGRIAKDPQNPGRYVVNGPNGYTGSAASWDNGQKNLARYLTKLAREQHDAKRKQGAAKPAPAAPADAPNPDELQARAAEADTPEALDVVEREALLVPDPQERSEVLATAKAKRDAVAQPQLAEPDPAPQTAPPAPVAEPPVASPLLMTTGTREGRDAIRAEFPEGTAVRLRPATDGSNYVGADDKWSVVGPARNNNVTVRESDHGTTVDVALDRLEKRDGAPAEVPAGDSSADREPEGPETPETDAPPAPKPKNRLPKNAQPQRADPDQAATGRSEDAPTPDYPESNEGATSEQPSRGDSPAVLGDVPAEPVRDDQRPDRVFPEPERAGGRADRESTADAAEPAAESDAPAGGSGASGSGGGRAGGRAARPGVPAAGAGDRGQASDRVDSAGVGGRDDDARAGSGDTAGDQSGAVAKPAERFKADSQADLARAGVKQKLADNLSAIRTLKQIEAEGRAATKAEQKTLARWAGWGSLPKVFDEKDPTYATEREELKSVLTDSEWRHAKGNVKNAHYTDHAIVTRLWDALGKLGFSGGDVLEAGSGSGNFIGAAPAGTRMTGVELDPITAGISRQLYPDADIYNESFANSPFRDGVFDAMIGNVPFGSYGLHDKRHNRGNHNIHNHFAIKGLHTLKPGGVMAIVTSSFALDGQDEKARREMYDQADLIAAIRLPENTHKAAAETSVVTDVLLLRKRKEGEPKGDDSWLKSSLAVDKDGKPVVGTARKGEDPEQQYINDYFTRNPDNMLGELKSGGYNGLKVVPNGDPLEGLTERLAAAAKTGKKFDPDLPKDGLDVAKRDSGNNREGRVFYTGTAEVERGVKNKKKVKEHQFVRVEDGRRVAFDVPGTQAEEFKGLLELRDLSEALLETERATDGSDDAAMEAARSQLRNAYRTHIAKHGPVSRHEVNETPDGDVQVKYPPVMGKFRQDEGAAFVFALEKDYDPDTDKAVEADILSKRQLDPNRKAASTTDDPADAVALAAEMHGGVTPKNLAKVLNTTPAKARRLVDDHVFEDPGTGRLVPKAEYRSDNVRRKLAVAKAAAADNPALAKNIEALEEVLPADATLGDVPIVLGAEFIGPDVVTAFAKHLMGRNNQVQVVNDPKAGWKVKTPSAKYGRIDTLERETWGTRGRSFYDLLEKALRGQHHIIRVTRKDSDGKSYYDKKASEEAQLKAAEIAQEFEDWVWATPAVGDKLIREYTDKHRSLVPRTYDDSPMRPFPGMTAAKTPRQHQNDAVTRGVNEPAVLFDHVVGSGKTYTLAALAMELKRLGMIDKPTLTVPNSLLAQWAKEFRELYPDAKVLAADGEMFKAKGGRKRFAAMVANNDWDVIVLPHETFASIPVSPEFEERYLARELEKYEKQKQAAIARGESKATVKNIETAKAKLAKSIQERIARRKDEDGITFESLGIDYIMADEAQKYKNLDFSTSMQGIQSPEGSGLARDMHMKLELLREMKADQQSPRIAAFATGTPISNSLAEMYAMTAFLRPDLLRDAGIEDFDSWAKAFAKVSAKVEQDTAANGWVEKVRLRGFTDALGDALRIWRTFTDTKTAEDLNLPRPKLKDGQRKIHAVDANEAQVAALAAFKYRLDTLPKGKPKEGDDTHVAIIGDGRRAAIDGRIMSKRGLAAAGLTREDEGEPSPKIQEAASEILRAWREHKDDRFKAEHDSDEDAPLPGALHMVMIDADAPKKGQRSSYQMLKDLLVAGGIPEDEVRFIQEAAGSSDKKARIQEDARQGKISVLMGSTPSLGTGTNVQNRLYSLHHIDGSWKPSDIAQREGRILRQGNQYGEVEIHAYVTKGTHDVKTWDMTAYKQAALDAIAVADFDEKGIEFADDVDPLTDFDTVTAGAAVDPLINDRRDLKPVLDKLTMAERSHRQQRDRARGMADDARVKINVLNARKERLEAALALREDVSGDNFRLGVNEYNGGAETPHVKRKDAAESLGRRITNLLEGGYIPDGEYEQGTVGSIGGFQIVATTEKIPGQGLKVRLELAMRPAGRSYGRPQALPMEPVKVSGADLKGNMDGVITRLTNRVEGIENAITGHDRLLENTQEELNAAEANKDRPFRYAADLADVRRQATLLDKILTGQIDTESGETPEMLRAEYADMRERGLKAAERERTERLDALKAKAAAKRNAKKDAPPVAATPAETAAARDRLAEEVAAKPDAAPVEEDTPDGEAVTLTPDDVAEDMAALDLDADSTDDLEPADEATPEEVDPPTERAPEPLEGSDAAEVQEMFDAADAEAAVEPEPIAPEDLPSTDDDDAPLMPAEPDDAPEDAPEPAETATEESDTVSVAPEDIPTVDGEPLTAPERVDEPEAAPVPAEVDAPDAEDAPADAPASAATRLAEVYGVDAALVGRLTPEEAETIMDRLLTEDLPPHLADTGADRGEQYRRRARELVTNALLQRQMNASPAQRENEEQEDDRGGSGAAGVGGDADAGAGGGGGDADADAPDGGGRRRPDNRRRRRNTPDPDPDSPSPDVVEPPVEPLAAAVPLGELPYDGNAGSGGGGGGGAGGGGAGDGGDTGTDTPDTPDADAPDVDETPAVDVDTPDADTATPDTDAEGDTDADEGPTLTIAPDDLPTIDPGDRQDEEWEQIAEAAENARQGALADGATDTEADEAADIAAADEAAAPADESGERVIPPAPPTPEQAHEPKTPTQIEGEKYPLTLQQQMVADAVVADRQNVKVEAKAGAGKTSTLEAIARRFQLLHPEEQIAYIAFNTSVAAEAQSRMPTNTESRTGHSLAMAWRGRDWLDKRFKNRNSLRRADEIADHLGITSNIGDMDPAQQAQSVMRAVSKYASSADDDIELGHFDGIGGLPEGQQRRLLGYAGKAWKDLQSDTGRIDPTFDHVRKMWALTRPDLSKKQGSGLKKAATVLFLDEAQDTPPVLAKVVADQKMQKVVVGDADQAIYGFTGATDYLATAEADVSLPLTKSWRFGPEVADYGNRFLQVKGSKDRVEGGGPGSRIVQDMAGADAILVRSNGGMIGEIVREQEAGRLVGVPKGTKSDLKLLTESARYLQGEGRAPSTMHDDLAPFRTWDEVGKAAEKGDDPKITMLHRILSQFGTDGLERIIDGVQELDDGGLAGASIGTEGNQTVLRNTFELNNRIKARTGSGMGRLGWKPGRDDEKKFIWTATGTPEQREAALARLREALAGETPDVVVSTAHKAKGLEWGRVRIGDDFRGPETDDEGNVTFPDDEELNLAYVAVTRAETELDPGSLAWVLPYSDPNGDGPPAGETRSYAPEDLPTLPDMDDPAEPAAAEEPETPAAPLAPEVPEEPAEMGDPPIPDAPERQDEEEPAPPAPEPEEIPDEPLEVLGRPAGWVPTGDLEPGDVARVSGDDGEGGAGTRTGHVLGVPEQVEVHQPGLPPQKGNRVPVGATRDGVGDRGTLLNADDAVAARATREPEAGDAPGARSGAEADVLSGRLGDEVPTGDNGIGVFPGSRVTDRSGRAGTVREVTARDAMVRWDGDDEDALVQPGTLTVDEGQSGRPAGWTRTGQRVQPGHMVRTGDGFVGPVESVDEDDAAILAPDGVRHENAGDLTVVGRVRADDAVEGHVEPTFDAPASPEGVDVRPTDPVKPEALPDGAAEVTPNLRPEHLTALNNLGLDTDGVTPFDAQQAALRLRHGMPISGDQARALSEHLQALMDAKDTKAGPVRQLKRIKNRLDAAAGRAEQAPAPSGEPFPTTAGDIVPGDVIALPDPATQQAEVGKVLTKEVAVVRTEDGTRNPNVLDVTIELPNGDTLTRRVAKGAQVWRLPDLPDPAGGPFVPPGSKTDEDAPFTEPRIAERVQNAAEAVVENALDDNADSIPELAAAADEAIEGDADSTDQRNAGRRLGTALEQSGVDEDSAARTRDVAEDAADRVRDQVAETVRNTLADAEPMLGESDGEAAERWRQWIRSEAPKTVDVDETVAEALADSRARETGQPGAAPTAEERATAEAETQDALRADLFEFADRLAEYGRPELANQLSQVAAELAGKPSEAQVQRAARALRMGRRPSLGGSFIARVRAIFARWRRWLLDRVKTLMGNRRRAARSLAAAVAAAKAEWNGNDPEIGRLVADAATHIAKGGDPDVPGEPTDFAGRVAFWRNQLPEGLGRFGYVDSDLPVYDRMSLADLTSGRTVTADTGPGQVLDRAADGGPGETALAHMAALKGLGRALDDEVQTRARAAVPDPDGDPAGYANAVQQATLDVLRAQRPIGPSGAARLNIMGRSDDADEVQALRWAEQFIPTEWLTSAGTVEAKAGRMGGYEADGTITVAPGLDSPVEGAGEYGASALHGLVHHLENTVPGLKAAQWAHHWAHTSDGPPGRRRRRGRNGLGWLRDLAPALGLTRADGAVRPGDYDDPWMGVEHDGGHYEVLPQAMVNLLAGLGENSDDHRQLILALLGYSKRGQ